MRGTGITKQVVWQRTYRGRRVVYVSELFPRLEHRRRSRPWWPFWYRLPLSSGQKPLERLLFSLDVRRYKNKVQTRGSGTFHLLQKIKVETYLIEQVLVLIVGFSPHRPRLIRHHIFTMRRIVGRVEIRLQFQK